MARQPRKLDSKQQAALDKVTELNLRHRDEKPRAAARAKKIVEEALAQMQYAEDMAVREALALGVRKSELHQKHQGLHSTDPYGVDKALKRTEAFADVVAEVEAATADTTPELHRIDADGTLVITPPREEVDEAARLLDLEDDTVVPYSARFTVTQFGKLDAVGGVTIPGTLDRDPVVWWAYKPENEAAAVDYFKENAR